MPTLGEIFPILDGSYKDLQFEETQRDVYRRSTIISPEGGIEIRLKPPFWLFSYTSSHGHELTLDGRGPDGINHAIRQIFSFIFESEHSRAYEILRGDGIRIEPPLEPQMKESHFGTLELLRQSQISKEWRGRFNNKVSFTTFDHIWASSTLFIHLEERDDLLELFQGRATTFRGQRAIMFKDDSFEGVLNLVNSWRNRIHGISSRLGVCTPSMEGIPWTQMIRRGLF